MAAVASENGKDVSAKKLKKTLDELKRSPQKAEYEEIILELECIRDGKGEPEIKPLALFLDVIDTIREEKRTPEETAVMLKRAKTIYNDLFPMGENTPYLEEAREMFKAIAGCKSLVERAYFDLPLYYSFIDKRNYLNLVKIVSAQKNAGRIWERIRQYALDIREYIVDDQGYFTHLLKITARLAAVGPDGYDAVLEEELFRLRRSNGIYDIDPVKLAQTEKNVREASLAIERGKNILQALEHKSRTMELLTEEISEKALEIQRGTEQYLDEKAGNIKSSLEASIKEYEDSQKKAVFMEKELFLKQMFSDAESELTKYKALAKTITATASADMAALNREAEDTLRQLKNTFSNDEKIAAYVEKSRLDEAILDKIDKLSILNDSNIEAIGNLVGKKPAGGQPEAAAQVMGQMPYIQPPHAERVCRPIPDANPLLDRKVPFETRYAAVMKEKKRRMNQGELFHEMFDDVMIAVLEDVNPYLIGPSGCGKTYMIKQIGSLLNIECTDIGYINEEYDILGYVTAMGDYNESNFYRLYKYGGIAFCDELDNGNSKATVKLNSFLTNQADSYYYFPGGERVDRHPNFRVIAAGNTDGSGADSNYSTRERIEESVQQRMIPIYVGYDNRVEKEILKAYPAWFEFACAFREATNRWSEVCGIPAQGIFTTRDAYRIRQYLANGSFAPAKIVSYEFVQTKEPEYLGFLKEEITRIISKSSNAYSIFQMFSEEVERIRAKGKRV
ncbi:MAG: AAA family ATPase [Lachnospiraceae bacterium]|nr:AAA family ATPase [Lachnospiraceae bacterium]